MLRYNFTGGKRRQEPEQKQSKIKNHFKIITIVIVQINLCCLYVLLLLSRACDGRAYTSNTVCAGVCLRLVVHLFIHLHSTTPHTVLVWHLLASCMGNRDRKSGIPGM